MKDKEVIRRAKKKIEEHVVNQKSRNQFAEIHTPPELIDKMLDQITDAEFEDPNSTFFDPCSGCGNYPVAIAERLVENDISYQHAIENQIYMVELQLKNCVMIERLLNPSGELNLNIKCVDSLELQTEYMEPSDWNKHRFRTHYKTSDFFNYEPKPEEFEKLEKVKELTDNESIIKNFERGYK